MGFARVASVASVLIVLLSACIGSEPPVEDERDLTLPPAESVAVLSDEPAVDEAPARSAHEVPVRSAQPAQLPREPTPPPPLEPVADVEPALTLPQGTALELTAADTIRSRMSVVGDPVAATAQFDVRDEQGRIVIPAGAVFTGRVAEIESAGSPGGVGTLVLSFSEVHFGGNTYPIAAESDSLGFEMKGQGISGGDAAKVGAGAVVGAVAGRVVGKNTKGAVIGGVVGAAAGAAVAAATKDQDIVLPAGGYVRIVLTQPLVLDASG
ncbi:MAG: hypothetical protein JSW71_14375 [Gemmatimonadota bacterium]|nr:MAG: hypothetical protein JSW71_14375 [Gemmatimonadota bacterium]